MTGSQSAQGGLRRGGISPQTFARLAAFIEGHAGIKMPTSKRMLVEGRLMRRLRNTPGATMDEYCEHVLSGQAGGEELTELINALTTNKTDFFREASHFDYLTSHILPQARRDGTGRLRCWSAAASTGMEAYTLAMVIDDFASRHGPLDFEILATDIDTKVLREARRGVYALASLEPIPSLLRARYVQRAVDPTRQEGRVVAELRRRIAFAQLNLMDAEYPVGAPMDLIFCRNVLIYFQKDVQAQVIARLCDNLKVGGHLVLGHSESIMGLALPLKCVTNTVFRKV